MRTVLTTTLTVVAIVVVLYLIYLLRKPIAWLVLATFIAVAVSGPVNWLNRRMRRSRAILLTYLALLLTPVAIGAVIIPPLLREGARFIDQLPQYATDVQEWVRGNERLRDLDEQYDITSRLQEEAARLPARAGDAAQWLGDLGLGIVNSTFAAVTILILSVFITSNGRRWSRARWRSSPPIARSASARRWIAWARPSERTSRARSSRPPSRA